MVARDAGGERDRRRARCSPQNGAAISPASIRRRRREEEAARKSAELFTAYLRKSREDVYALSTLPPGRFLMPGDLEGSPALTFAPLPIEEGAEIGPPRSPR